LKGRQNLLPKYWIGLGLSPRGPAATFSTCSARDDPVSFYFPFPFKKENKRKENGVAAKFVKYMPRKQ